MEPWIAAPVLLVLLVVGLQGHQRWLAIFPEDPPGTGRHQHRRPTPMAGFLPALVAIAALIHASASPYLIGGIALAMLTGYLDDRGKQVGRAMGWRRKSLLLITATSLALVAAAQTHDLNVEACAIAFVWLFALTNAVNFMDNTDGVAASLGASGLLLASGGEGPIAFAGFAYLGFVPANWPRPQVFLGDSGSLSLGLILAYATLGLGLDAADLRQTVPTWPLTWLAVAPICMFALDFIQVIVARLVLGHPPWLGDRRHLTHIAMNLGVKPVWIAPIFVALGIAGYQLVTDGV